jgi:hypothetical protein
MWWGQSPDLALCLFFFHARLFLCAYTGANLSVRVPSPVERCQGNRRIIHAVFDPQPLLWQLAADCDEYPPLYTVYT